MGLVITEEQKMLKDSAAELLKTKAPISQMRILRDQGYQSFDSSTWEEMVAMGWTALTVPEQYNGLDFGYVGLGQILEETGKHLTKSPLISSILLGATALRYSDNESLKERYFPGIMSGDVQLAYAMQEREHFQAIYSDTHAKLEEDHYVINGKKTMVIDGMNATHFVVMVQMEADLYFFLVDTESEGITLKNSILMDSGNYAEVHLDQVKVSTEHLLNIKTNGEKMLHRILASAYSGLSAEMLGICQQAFDLTIRYLKERQQFGVVIGTFQGLQHRAAKMFCELELCKSVVLKALQRIDQGEDDALKYGHLAKAKLSKTIKLITSEAIQMHGGIGVTDDADIGFYLKRARVLEQLFGGYNYHLDQLARLKNY
ncbi:MAG: acyl-CoA dehydrogenase family protein [Flavobacteriaceae bacterium]